MIEDDDVIEEQQPRVRNPDIVRMRVGDALAPACDAVSEEADRAAEERR